MLEQVQNFVCGYVSGCVQIFVMQPFQIIKVRLQTQNRHNPQYNGIIDCFKKIMKEEGPLAFYKGTLAPLIGVGAQVSIQFGSNELSKKTMESFHDGEEQILPMSHIIIAGMMTGFPSSIAITPVDHLRILMQIQHGKNNKYHGSVDAGIQIFKKHGIKGLYLGFPITLYRQILAMGAYFGFYEWGMRQLAPEGESSSETPIAASFFVGGLAGMYSWLVTYPLDYTKTLIQTQDLDNKIYKSTWQCMKSRYKEEGFNTFYRGLGITMIRSFPVNASGFLAFQSTMRYMTKMRNQENIQNIEN